MSSIKCPIWYSRLNEDLQTHIKTLIGDSIKISTDLENLLMDECGTDRKDVQDLLRWWFGGRHSTFFFSAQIIIKVMECGLLRGYFLKAFDQNLPKILM